MTTLAPEDASVGGLLRTWRQRRRLSQLELSSRAEVSTRHLSCIETFVPADASTEEALRRLASTWG